MPFSPYDQTLPPQSIALKTSYIDQITSRQLLQYFTNAEMKAIFTN